MHGFLQQRLEAVEVGDLKLWLELWKHPQGECLIYLPPIPHTQSGDILYITEQERLNLFLVLLKQ